MRHTSARSRRFVVASVVASLALSLVVSAVAATPARAGRVPTVQTFLQLTAAGTGFIGTGGVGSADSTGDPATELRPSLGAKRHDADEATTTAPPTTTPTPTPNGIAATNPRFSGFNGLNHFNQRTSGTGIYTNTQLNLEPPDQGLCVGNGFVLELVNDVLAAFSTTGARLSGPTPMNQFLKLAPALIRTPTVKFGDFLSDPKCYFDADTNRWFVTILQIDRDPTTGLFGPRSRLELAVSKTGSPTGDWNLFALDVTNDGAKGTPSHAHCPCIGDQPLIGADRFGFYISTNEFGPTPAFSFFNGAQIYAMSKTALAAGALPTVVHTEGGPLAEDISSSIQPATTPPHRSDDPDEREPGDFDESETGGTEFFLSSLDFQSTLDNRIAVWALGNTSSLASATPSVHLSNAVLRSQTYGQGLSVFQKDGSNPFGATQFRNAAGQVVRQPVPRLAFNDHRMNQVVFADGRLFGALNTVLGGGTRRAGIAWFVVKAELDDEGVEGEVERQGYISLASRQLLFPSIAVNRKGRGLLAFTAVGLDLFPSAAYATFDRRKGVGEVHIAAMGLGPEDGFSGYRRDGVADGVQRIARWGDYSAAVADADGSIWFATEYIAQTCTSTQFLADNTCGGTRTLLANWGTFVGRVAR